MSPPDLLPFNWCMPSSSRLLCKTMLCCKCVCKTGVVCEVHQLVSVWLGVGSGECVCCVWDRWVINTVWIWCVMDMCLCFWLWWCERSGGEWTGDWIKHTIRNCQVWGRIGIIQRHGHPSHHYTSPTPPHEVYRHYYGMFIMLFPFFGWYISHVWRPTATQTRHPHVGHQFKLAITELVQHMHGCDVMKLSLI